MIDEFIDTVEAAEILQVADCRAARRVLNREGVSLRRDRRGWLLVSRAVVENLAQKRGGKVGRGRPRKNIPIGV